MKKYFISLTLLFYLFVVWPTMAQERPRKDLDSMLHLLSQTKPSIERADLLLHIAQFHIFKPGENQIDFDSAAAYLNQADILNKSFRSPVILGYHLLTQAIMMKEQGKRDIAKQLAVKAVSILESAGNIYYLAKAHFELSDFYTYKIEQEYYEKLRLVELAVAGYRKTDKWVEKGYCLTMLADLQLIGGEYENAINNLNEALAAYDSAKFPLRHGVYDLLGRIYHAKSDYNRSLQYNLLALKSIEADKDSTMQLCTISNSVGMTYRRIGRMDMAIKYCKTALQVAMKHDDRFAIALVVYNLSVCYSDIGQQPEILILLASLPQKSLESDSPIEKCRVAMAYISGYVGTNQYQKADKYCRTLINTMDDPRIFESVRPFIYHTLASYFMATRQYDNARFYLSKNLPDPKNPPTMPPIINDYKLRYKLDSIQGNYISAIRHLLTYKSLNDSIFNITKARQFQQLELEYETEKKADSLKLQNEHIALLTQKNDLQQANLKHADLIKNVTIGGILLAVLIIILLYRQYRHKQQSNKVISHKNDQLQHLLTEKEWLLKEVHHRVKNNLQTVVSLLELQPDSLQVEAATAMRDSRNRIYTMSLVHQKLYQSENIASVNMRAYLSELVNHLQDIYNIGNSIRIYLRVVPVELDVSQAIPVGLIVNEAVTNCIKYAFKGNQITREISVSLQEKNNRQLELEIADNGKGLSPDFEKANRNGFGFRLMKGLAEDIEGTLVIKSDNGLHISVTFRANIPFYKLSAENIPAKAVLV